MPCSAHAHSLLRAGEAVPGGGPRTQSPRAPKRVGAQPPVTVAGVSAGRARMWGGGSRLALDSGRTLPDAEPKAQPFPLSCHLPPAPSPVSLKGTMWGGLQVRSQRPHPPLTVVTRASQERGLDAYCLPGLAAWGTSAPLHPCSAPAGSPASLIWAHGPHPSLHTGDPSWGQGGPVSLHSRSPRASSLAPRALGTPAALPAPSDSHSGFCKTKEARGYRTPQLEAESCLWALASLLLLCPRASWPPKPRGTCWGTFPMWGSPPKGDYPLTGGEVTLNLVQDTDWCPGLPAMRPSLGRVRHRGSWKENERFAGGAAHPPRLEGWAGEEAGPQWSLCGSLPLPWPEARGVGCCGGAIPRGFSTL